MSFGAKLAKHAAAALICAAFAPSLAQATTAPDGLSFHVKVNNQGNVFKDCFSFDSAGNLTVAGLATYGTMVFADKTFGKTVSWLAVAGQSFVDAFGSGIMFTGGVLSNGNLYATGMSSSANTYTIVGKPAKKCTAADISVHGWR